MLVLLAVMLTACSELQNFAAIRPTTVRTEECDVDRLMMSLHDTRSMTTVQLQQTLKTWEQEFQSDPSDNHRLKLALLYAAGNASVRDPGRAQELLNETTGVPDNPGDREFAAVIRQFLDNQIDANRKINDLNKQIADLNKHIAELKQQQRALTNIERKMQQRDTPAVIKDEK